MAERPKLMSNGPGVSLNNAHTAFLTFSGLSSILNKADQCNYPASIVRSWRHITEPGGKPDGLAKPISDCLPVYNPTLRTRVHPGSVVPAA
jgi:hypothetical protein